MYGATPAEVHVPTDRVAFPCDGVSGEGGGRVRTVGYSSSLMPSSEPTWAPWPRYSFSPSCSVKLYWPSPEVFGSGTDCRPTLKSGVKSNWPSFGPAMVGASKPLGGNHYVILLVICCLLTD